MLNVMPIVKVNYSEMYRIEFFSREELTENCLRSVRGGEAYTCPEGYDHDWVSDDGCTSYYKNRGHDHEVCDTESCEYGGL